MAFATIDGEIELLIFLGEGSFIVDIPIDGVRAELGGGADEAGEFGDGVECCFVLVCCPLVMVSEVVIAEICA